MYKNIFKLNLASCARSPSPRLQFVSTRTRRCSNRTLRCSFRDSVLILDFEEKLLSFSFLMKNVFGKKHSTLQLMVSLAMFSFFSYCGRFQAPTSARYSGHLEHDAAICEPQVTLPCGWPRTRISLQYSDLSDCYIELQKNECPQSAQDFRRSSEMQSLVYMFARGREKPSP